MAQYERKYLKYVEEAEDDAPMVKYYDSICRGVSLFAAVLLVFAITRANILGFLPYGVNTFIRVVLLIATALICDYLLQKFIFGPKIRKLKK